MVEARTKYRTLRLLGVLFPPLPPPYQSEGARSNLAPLYKGRDRADPQHILRLLVPLLVVDIPEGRRPYLVRACKEGRLRDDIRVEERDVTPGSLVKPPTVFVVNRITGGTRGERLPWGWGEGSLPGVQEGISIEVNFDEFVSRWGYRLLGLIVLAPVVGRGRPSLPTPHHRSHHRGGWWPPCYGCLLEGCVYKVDIKGLEHRGSILGREPLEHSPPRSPIHLGERHQELGGD